ncbi:MAG: LLM class flavin-dependent oxidoreductase [Microbacteriaceae bacterium]
MSDQPLSLFAFDMQTPSHLTAGSWRIDGDQGYRHTDLKYWTRVAKELEEARFDGIFFADNVGYHDVYQGSADAAIKDAAQMPNLDPTMVISAMAAATEHLTFGVTCSLTYEQPYLLARKFSTLDHLTDGRIGWNVVTSYSESAARNLGMTEQIPHDQRYDMAEEYMEVCYKLWESSWDQDAVIMDRVGGRYADPSRIHPIEHVGKYFSVQGFNLTQPSPQRTPLLFQAGSSSRGMAFAGKHAESVFINTTSVEAAARSVTKIRQATADAGRDPESVKIVVLLTVIVDTTDERAAAKHERYAREVSIEGALARFSGWTGIDMSPYDLDTPLKNVQTKGIQSIVDMFSKTDPDQDWTPRKVAEFLGIGGTGSTIVGSPTTVAAELQRWRAAGVDGINLSYATKPGDWEQFIELALPELRRQGLIADTRESGPALTLRERLYGRGHAHTLQDHPASAYRSRAVAPAAI